MLVRFVEEVILHALSLQIFTIFKYWENNYLSVNHMENKKY